MRRSHTIEPVLITSAHESGDAEFDRRRRKYAIIMAIRALCVVGAAYIYQVSVVLALVLVLGGMVLPWCAVLIANDRPAKRRTATPDPRYDLRAEAALLSADDDRTVDG